MIDSETDIPLQLQFFIKQKNRFFVNAPSTQRIDLLFKIYLETLRVHPSDNPHEMALFQAPLTISSLDFHNEFEIMALNGDIQGIEAKADLLVTMDFDEVRDPLSMLLGNKIRTRPGLSLDGILARPAADPASVRDLIRKHPRPVTDHTIQYWLTHCSGRAIEYYKLNGYPIEHH
jgi:hypothetical protein